ncbi:hypothetical protein [Kineothrix alysoides]|uniref:hypothetical protein n=1 Tax=Kineothrix alysoides TaxID=1469948 RepID=UPI001FA6E581|nr:hypothetical protein [Kineothrix alysoides]
MAAKADAATERFHSASGKLKQTEAAMTRNADLKAVIVYYARTHPIFDEYKARKCSRAYLAEHEADISVYRAAQTAMRELLNGERLPKMDALKAEWQELKTAKKSDYAGRLPRRTKGYAGGRGSQGQYRPSSRPRRARKKQENGAIAK